MPLTESDRELLDLEESWWTRPGAKHTAIRQRLGFSPSTYYKRLAELVETPEALEESPLVVRRVRRRLLERRRGRFEGLAQPQHPRR
jgi:Protein of unknown function (DUF3263)